MDKILKELDRRKRSFSTLATFAEEFLEVIPALHHKVICYEIDRLLADDYDDLIINTPPGSAKSTYASIALPAYFIGKYPDKVILGASHSFPLMERWGKKVRNIINSPTFDAASDGVKLSPDTRAAAEWETTQGGGFFGVGVGGAALGRRCDLGVIDDPISGWEQANSLTQLKKIHDWYDTDYTSRLKPGAKTVLICQRLARNDLAGHIIDQHKADPIRRLKVLNIKMECLDSAVDPLGRLEGDRLWPEWYTAQMVRTFKRDDFIWRTMYQQEPPADDGAWANTEDIRFRPSPTITSNTVLYGMTDIALSVNTGDYTVHAILAVASDGSCDIIEMVRDRVDPNESSKNLVALAKIYKPVEWLIDDDNASKVFVHLVASEARNTGTPVNWKPMPMRGQDKETRAAALRGMYKRGLIFMPADAPWAKWLTTEIILFPNATGQGVDDGVDTLSLIGRRLSVISIPNAPVMHEPLKTTQEMCLEELWGSQPKQRVARV
jgi:predicted phage terminase large subunit-like protein